MAAAGVRTTKGLYFTFTLLCLVCLASSLIGKDQLEKLKETLQGAQQTLDRVKANHISDWPMDDYVKKMEQIEASMKREVTNLPEDFPSMAGVVQSYKDFMEKGRTYLENEKEELGAQIEELEREVGKMKKLIEFLEENHDEL